MTPQFTFQCSDESTPQKIFEASPQPPRGVYFFCIVTPSGKQWFVPIMPAAMRMS